MATIYTPDMAQKDMDMEQKSFYVKTYLRPTHPPEHIQIQMEINVKI